MPDPLARLTLRLMVVDPDARPTAEEARVALANMAAESLGWGAEGDLPAEVVTGAYTPPLTM